MSRIKKSRKPGKGSSGVIKEEKKTLEARKDKKPKKKTGKQAGNKQQEAKPKKKGQAQLAVKKDPRIGSKKPILLVKESAKPANKPKKSKEQAIAAVRTIEPDESLEQDLYAIEQDPKLLLILEKQEAEQELTEEEVDYYNQLMERHQQIRSQLGWDDDEETKEESAASSEEDLWDKLDTSDFSDYQ